MPFKYRLVSDDFEGRWQPLAQYHAEDAKRAALTLVAVGAAQGGPPVEAANVFGGGAPRIFVEVADDNGNVIMTTRGNK